MNTFQIAIDGPASSGKSTLAKRLAIYYNYIYLDTGAMYRAFTLYALKNGVPAEPCEELNALLDNVHISFDIVGQDQIVILNGEDVSEVIRSREVSNKVSAYAALKDVRQHLVKAQQVIAQKSHGIVMDGRDIGTVVLLNAQVKFFLTASVAVRAERRFLENKEKGFADESLEIIASEIAKRDAFDSNREDSPLKQAQDAIVIDTTDQTIDQVFSQMVTQIDRIKNKTLIE